MDEAVKVYPISFEKALKRIDEKFDYVYCDPPYHFKNTTKLFELLVNVIHKDTIIFYEADKKEDMPIPKGYTCLREDDYKRAKIMWFQLDQSQ